MGTAKIPEKIEERRNDSSFMSQKSDAPKSPPTVQELHKQIKLLNIQIAALNNGDEISHLCNTVKDLQAKNTRLEKSNAKLEKTIQKLSKNIQDLQGKVDKKSNGKGNIDEKMGVKIRPKPMLSDYLSKLDYKKNGDSKFKKRKKK